MLWETDPDKMTPEQLDCIADHLLKKALGENAPIAEINRRLADDFDVTVVCALFDSNGNYLKGVQKVVELRLKDENVEHRRNLGLTMNADFDVKRGGYMIRVVARDAEGQQMATANDVMEIP